jgi:hypothetical protein
MIITKWLFITGFLIPFYLFAQIDETQIKPRTILPGYVVSLDGDTTTGYLFFTTLIGNQTHIKFYRDQEGKNPVDDFKPGTIKSYGFSDLHYASVPFSGKGYGKNKSFMIRLVEGPVSLYKWYYSESTMMSGDDLNEAMGKESVLKTEPAEGLEVQVFGVRGNEEPEDFYSTGFAMNFKKKMSAYLSDYPELAGKIADKTPGYRHDSLVKIIREYNAWCEQKH